MNTQQSLHFETGFIILNRFYIRLHFTDEFIMISLFCWLRKLNERTRHVAATSNSSLYSLHYSTQTILHFFYKYLDEPKIFWISFFIIITSQHLRLLQVYSNDVCRATIILINFTKKKFDFLLIYAPHMLLHLFFIRLYLLELLLYLCFRFYLCLFEEV